MKHQFPTTSSSLLTRLRESCDGQNWQGSWKRFLELYHEPLTTTARACYRFHCGGQDPSPDFVEDAVATVISEFSRKAQYRYDANKAKLRTYLRSITNARVVDALRKERPSKRAELPSWETVELPIETDTESKAFHRALLATLVEDLREQIPLPQFEIFERIKLKGQPPKAVAEEFGIGRNAVDKSIHKTMTKLRELARQPEYQEEFYL